jgi:signal transduction histidine kinase
VTAAGRSHIGHKSIVRRLWSVVVVRTPPYAAWTMATQRTLLPSILLADGPSAGGQVPPRTTRDWIVDVVLFLVATGGGLAGFFGEFADHHGNGLVVTADLAGGVLVWAALWWRRRWPVQLALLAAPIGAYSNAAGAATLILLFTVAVHRPWRTVAVVAASHMAGTFVFAVLYPDSDLSYPVWVIFINVLIGGVVAWGMFIRARRELVLSLRERALRAESDQAQRAQQARDAERARIAREMHDVLAHRISLLSMHAGALEFRPDAPPAEVARAAGVIRAAAHEALEDLREVIGVLRSDAGQAVDVDVDGAPARPQPTLADLPALLEESRGAGMRIREELQVAPADGAALPASAGRTVYRIVQEGLTNARKHADGAGVVVRLTGSPADGLTAEIVNRAPVGSAGALGGGSRGGAGPVAAVIPGAGTGIVGLAERAALAGGRLEHGPTDEGGFALRAWLPWPA